MVSGERSRQGGAASCGMNHYTDRSRSGGWPKWANGSLRLVGGSIGLFQDRSIVAKGRGGTWQLFPVAAGRASSSAMVLSLEPSCRDPRCGWLVLGRQQMPFKWRRCRHCGRDTVASDDCFPKAAFMSLKSSVGRARLLTALFLSGALGLGTLAVGCRDERKHVDGILDLPEVEYSLVWHGSAPVFGTMPLPAEPSM